MRDHKNLRAFDLADQLALSTYRVTASFPDSEKFGLVSQMRRASVSVASNNVEGCTRNSQGDFTRFIELAYGSAKEMEYQISLANRLGFIDSNQHDAINSICNETCKVLNGLIRSLRSTS